MPHAARNWRAPCMTDPLIEAGDLKRSYRVSRGPVTKVAQEAGHYHSKTNIAAGLDEAREELQENARIGALKMIVLMTDGVATYPYSPSYSRNLALEAAEMCAAAKFPVVTIALGSGADTALMEEIADMTGGLYFRVPGGRPITEVEEDLRETFRKIAEKRPLMMVQAGRGSGHW